MLDKDSMPNTHSAGAAVAHHPALQHHFDDMEQQREASSLGMWVFLMTEVMFFGGLFLAYLVYRTTYPEAFAAGSSTLNVPLGAINTAVLIGSSFTMAMAVWSAQMGKTRLIQIFLILWETFFFTFYWCSLFSLSWRSLFCCRCF